jgi:hypothetical protein
VAGGEFAAGCGCAGVAEEGWEWVSDAGEPNAAGTDAEGFGGAVGFLWTDPSITRNDPSGKSRGSSPTQAELGWGTRLRGGAGFRVGHPPWLVG